jgi:hypothetical protein
LAVQQAQVCYGRGTKECRSLLQNEEASLTHFYVSGVSIGAVLGLGCYSEVLKIEKGGLIGTFAIAVSRGFRKLGKVEWRPSNVAGAVEQRMQATWRTCCELCVEICRFSCKEGEGKRYTSLVIRHTRSMVGHAMNRAD